MEKIFISVELPDSSAISAQFLVALIIELNRVAQHWDEEAVSILAHDAGISEGKSNNVLLHAKRNTNKLFLDSVHQGSAVFIFLVGGMAGYILKTVEAAVSNVASDVMELSRYNKRIIELLAELYDISMSTSKFGKFITTSLEGRIIKIKISKDIGDEGNLSLPDDSEVLGVFSETERPEQLPHPLGTSGGKSFQSKIHSPQES